MTLSPASAMSARWATSHTYTGAEEYARTGRREHGAQADTTARAGDAWASTSAARAPRGPERAPDRHREHHAEAQDVDRHADGPQGRGRGVGLWVQQAISGLVETARSEATGAAANRDAAGQAQPVVSRQQLQHDVKDLMHEVFSALRDRRDEARTVLTGSEVSANAAAKTPISPTGAAVGSTPASPQAVGTTAVAAAAMHDVTTDQTKGTSDPQLTVDADMARRGAAASPGTARPYGMGAGFADRLSGLIDEVAAGRAPGALQSAFDTLMRDLGVQSAGTSLTQRTAAMVTFPMNATAGDAGTSPDLHAVDTPWRADAGAPAQAAKPAITVGRNMADDEGLSFAAGGTGSLLSSSAAALQAFLERLRAPMATEGGAMRTGHFLNVSA